MKLDDIYSHHRPKFLNDTQILKAMGGLLDESDGRKAHLNDYFVAVKGDVDSHLADLNTYSAAIWEKKETWRALDALGLYVQGTAVVRLRPKSYDSLFKLADKDWVVKIYEYCTVDFSQTSRD